MSRIASIADAMRPRIESTAGRLAWLVLLGAIASSACNRPEGDPTSGASSAAAKSSNPFEAPPLIDANKLDHVPAEKKRSVILDSVRPRRMSLGLGRPALNCRFDEPMRRLECGGPAFIDATAQAKDWTWVNDMDGPKVLPSAGPERWMRIDPERRNIETYFGALAGAVATDDGGTSILIREPMGEACRLYHVGGDGKTRELTLPKGAQSPSTVLVGSWLIWRTEAFTPARQAIHAAKIGAAGDLGPAIVADGADAGLGLQHACNHPTGIRLVFGSIDAAQVLIQAGESWKLIDAPNSKLKIQDVDEHVPLLLSRPTCTDDGVILAWGEPKSATGADGAIDVHTVSCTMKGCAAGPVPNVPLHGTGMFPTVPVVAVGNKVLMMWPRESVGLLMVLAPIGELATTQPVRVLEGEWTWPEQLFASGDTAFAVVKLGMNRVGVLRVDLDGTVTAIPIARKQPP